MIFLVALALRVFHLRQIRDAPFFTVLMGDSRAYDEWAQRLAHGDWIGTEVFYQAPLYPYFLGALYAIGGRDLLAVRVCQAIIGALACVMLGIAGWRIFSKRVGIASGLMLAFYAPAIFFDGLVQKSTLDVFFVCLAVALVGGLLAGRRSQGLSGDITPRLHSGCPERQSRDKGRAAGWFWLGVVMGALSLTRENAIALVAVLLGWGLTRPGEPARERLVGPAVFVLGLALVLVPVATRNLAVGGGFYLTTAQFGPNLFIGNNPRADGTYMSLRFGRGSPEYEREDATELAEQAEGRRLTPAEVSRYWTQRALAFMRSQPAAWLALLGRKVMLLCNASEMLDTESQDTHADWSTLLRAGARIWHFGLLVPLAVFGVWATWSERARIWILYAMPAAYAASVVMFYVFARYRYPLVPFIVLFASAGLVAAPRLLRTTPRHRLLAVGVAVAAAALVSNRSLLSADTMRAITENNLATALQSDGRREEAITHYRRAISIDASYAPAYNNLGTALRASGRLPDAIVEYQRALRLRPDFPSAHYNLGNALLADGTPDGAIRHFREALRSSPASVEVHNNLGLALAARGDLESAVAQFRVALSLDADSAQAHSNLGNALASQGANEPALVHLRRAIDLAPADAATRYDLGSVLLEQGQYVKAIDEFRAAIRLRPTAQAHNNLGIALGASGRLDEAIVEFRAALNLRPGFADAVRNLSVAESQRDERGKRTKEKGQP